MKQHSGFAELCNKKLQKGPSALELFEGWMTHGTDHWFIKPSIWEKLPPDRQARVLADLQSTDAAAGADPSEPIFDDLRSLFMQAMEKQFEAEKSNLVLQQIIQNEHLKLRGQKLEDVFPWGNVVQAQKAQLPENK